jgi:integrase
MQLISVKVILDTRRQKKDGTYPVKLRLAFDYNQKYYNLNSFFSEEKWDQIMKAKTSGTNYELQLFYKNLERKAIETINNLHPFSITGFEREYFKRSYNKADMLSMMKEYRNNLYKKERTGTAKCYDSTCSSISKYLKLKKLPNPIFEDITPEWLTNYEDWMLEEGRSVTTVGIYTRNIRTIINIAIEDGLLNHDAYPFGKRKYIIPASRNIKKALSKEEIKLIYNYEPIHDAEQRARDIWMFSYLCNGINMKDIAQLKHSNIDGNQLSFIRAKTINTKKQDRKPIRANINAPMRKIIQKWGRASLNPDDYIFDILSKKDTPEDIYKKVKLATKVINNYMKRIGVNLGIEQKVTTYSARHSFATILKNSNTSTQYISEALGHTSLQTTAIYLDSFENEEIEKNQEKLLDF